MNRNRNMSHLHEFEFSYWEVNIVFEGNATNESSNV